MSSQSKEVFRLSWRSPLFLVYTLFIAYLVFESWPHFIELIVQYIVFSAMFLMISNVSINKDEISLYYINKLEWHNIKSVKSKSVFGLPYLLITRKSGLNWWLPLYLSGSRSMLVALAEWAPENNPLKSYEHTK
tara:strand:+ start:54 stop:455 length:402 start_codon:yes stop_codon:yes gene_type:complete